MKNKADGNKKDGTDTTSTPSRKAAPKADASTVEARTTRIGAPAKAEEKTASLETRAKERAKATARVRDHPRA